MTGEYIQSYIDSLSRKGGGIYQLLQNYVYNIEKTLIIPPNVTLSGDYGTMFSAVSSLDNMVLFKNVSSSGIRDIIITTASPMVKIDKAICVYGNCKNIGIKNIKTYRGMIPSAFNIGISVQVDDRNKDNILRPEDITVSFNSIKKCNLACYMDGVGTSTIEYNNFSDSSENINFKHSGMIICRGDNCRILFNFMNNNAGHGLYLSGCKYNMVLGNMITMNNNAGIHVRYFGDPNKPVKDEFNIITSNNCSYNGQDLVVKGNGIHIQEHTSENTITNNICCFNTADGIRLHGVGAEDNVVIGNVAKGNHDGDIISENPNVVENNIVGGKNA